MVKRRYCLIRMGDFVELRSTVKGIKKVISKFTTKGESLPYTLKQVYYEGGKVLGTWDYQTFVGQFGATMKDDTLVQVTKTQALDYLKRGIKW